MPRPSMHIIDDDEDICSEVTDALLALGYDCTWATSPERLSRPDGSAPDVILLDLSMPGVDGFQVIRRLAEEQHQPHLIVASGHARRIIRAAVRCAREAGLNVLGSLEKPYSIRSLLTLLESAAVATPKAPCEQKALVRKLVTSDAPDRAVQTAFQTKRALSDGAIVGYEALLRIAVDGIAINPEAIFDPQINLDTQLVITRAVLDDAMRFGAVLRSDGRPATISVNCAPAILCSPELPNMVQEVLDRWQMPAASLMIEITEQAAGHSFEEVATEACRLAMRGCGISIDDFGRGTTSLERLFDLPLNELKIDKAIFWKCFEGREPSGLLQEVVRYCKERGIDTTIEGIETGAHRAHACSLGAGQGQGYLWDRPALLLGGTFRRAGYRLDRAVSA